MSDDSALAAVPPAPEPGPEHAFGHRPNGAVADPLDDAQFADFFAVRAAPGLQALEAERVAAVSSFRLRAIVTVLVAVVCAAILGPVSGGRLIFVPLIGAGVLLTIFYLPLKRLGEEAKVRLLTVITAALGFAYQLNGFDPPGYDRLRKTGLLPNPDRSNFDDLFSGERSKVAFAMCDAHLEVEEGSGKDSHWVTVFRGQLIRLAIPQAFQGVTVIARDAGLFNLLHKPQGLQRVGLGASSFEKDFEVYSTDQVEARFLVHPAFMQKLLDMESAYQGCKLRGMFCDGELLIAVEGRDRFTFGNPFHRFDDIGPAQEAADDLRQVLGLIDFVLAGPPRAPELGPAG